MSFPHPWHHEKRAHLSRSAAGIFMGFRFQTAKIHEASIARWAFHLSGNDRLSAFLPGLSQLLIVNHLFGSAILSPLKNTVKDVMISPNRSTRVS